MSTWETIPHKIEAFRWTGDPDQTEDPEWFIEMLEIGYVVVVGKGTPNLALKVGTKDARLITPPVWVVKDGYFVKYYTDVQFHNNYRVSEGQE